MVFDEIVDKLPDYTFHLTEGPQTQEIFVGVRKNLQAFFSQKTTFKSGASMLRPGALLTITKHGHNYSLLFLHLKSMTVPKGFGLRDDMTQRAMDFKKTLDKAHKKKGLPGKSNFIFLGDLNTMGMNLTFSKKDISAQEEIDRLSKRLAAKSVSMRILSKTDPTYWPGSQSDYPIGDLDHVVAANHLQFKSFSGTEVDVRGWVEKSTDNQKDKWAEKFSDHALLFFEVQEV